MIDFAGTMKQLGRCVPFYPSLSRAVGQNESILLCQLLYWTPKTNDKDGWIYKTVEELEEETGLTYKQQIRCRESLVKQGLLEQNHDREAHRLYFRVAADKLNRLWEQLTKGHLPKGKVPHDQRSGTTCPKVSSYKEHKITQEITTLEKPCPPPENGADGGNSDSSWFTSKEPDDLRHRDTMRYFIDKWYAVRQKEDFPRAEIMGKNLSKWLNSRPERSYPQSLINTCIDNWAQSHPRWHTKWEAWQIVLHLEQFETGALSEFNTQIGITLDKQAVKADIANKRLAAELDYIKGFGARQHGNKL